MVAGRKEQKGEISSGAIPLVLAVTLLASVFVASAGSSFLRTMGGGGGDGLGTVAASAGAVVAPVRATPAQAGAEPNAARGRIAERLPGPGGAVEKAGEGRLLLPLSGFGKPELARELQDTLATMGVQTRMEARVVAGPFATEAEAESMRGRLRALGLDTGGTEPVR